MSADRDVMTPSASLAVNERRHEVKVPISPLRDSEKGSAVGGEPSPQVALGTCDGCEAETGFQHLSDAELEVFVCLCDDCYQDMQRAWEEMPVSDRAEIERMLEAERRYQRGDGPDPNDWLDG